MYKTISICVGLLSYTAIAQGATEDNVSKGRAIYAKCMGCHSPERNRTGPKHCGIIGRKIGTVEDFDYSPAMEKSNIIWSEETLDKFLSEPLKTIPGTNMAIAGISNKIDRRNLISYLASLNQGFRCQ